MITPDFLTAGKAIFTVDNGRGLHYTFKVITKDDRKNPGQTISFVHLLTGPDNTADYSYLGMMNKHAAFPTAASQMNAQAMPFLVLNWAIKVIYGRIRLKPGYRIQHEGLCGRCARELTDPVSIETGLGPLCRKKARASLQVRAILVK